jgi:hypothetical protein
MSPSETDTHARPIRVEASATGFAHFGVAATVAVASSTIEILRAETGDVRPFRWGFRYRRACSFGN